jgi:hypothetical protein
MSNRKISKKSKKKKSKPFKETYGKPLSVIRKAFIVKKKDNEGKVYLGSETLIVKCY